jgi:integrase
MAVRKRHKRGQNEGSIFQRADGRWCAMLNLGWHDGKLKRKSFYGASAEEVRKQLTAAQKARDDGQPILTDGQTVAQFLADWLENTVKPNAQPRSYEKFSDAARLHVVPTLGRVKLDKLSPQQVQKLLNQKLESGLAPQTVVGIRTMLRTALAQALKWGLVTRNVAALVDPPRIPESKVNALTPEQARALLAAAEGDRFEPIFVLALNCGMRRGEILGLRWQDVNFEAGVLRINQAVQRVRAGLAITELKTKRSRRSIAISASVMRVLKARHVRQLEERLFAGADGQDTGLVFTNSKGGMVEPITLHRAYKRLLAKAGISTETRFHDLRHSAASLLLAQGVPLRSIMELLGHSSIALTANLYAHVGEQLKRETAEAMETILGR